MLHTLGACRGSRKGACASLCCCSVQSSHPGHARGAQGKEVEYSLRAFLLGGYMASTPSNPKTLHLQMCPQPGAQGKEVEYSLRAIPLGGYVA